MRNLLAIADLERSDIERITDQSAIRPATQVPATMPRPKASRKNGATDSGSPPTSVIVGTM